MAPKRKESVEEHLAHKRTELAHERTILSYIRTAAALFLFGVAFIGFQEQARILFYGGRIAITLGIIFILIAIVRVWKHQTELHHIRVKFRLTKIKNKRYTNHK